MNVGVSKDKNFDTPTFFVNKESTGVEISSKMELHHPILKGDSPMLYNDYTQEMIGFKGATVTFVERTQIAS